MADGPKRLAQGTEGDRVGGMGVDYAVDVRAGLEDLRMDKDLGVTLVFALDLLAI